MTGSVTSPGLSGETAAAPEDKSKHKKEAEPETLGGFLKFLAKLVIAVVLFRSLVFSPFNIPSESMLPRLMNGDYLLASKWAYGFSGYSLWPVEPDTEGRIFASQPERGDVVIFKHPVDGVDYIKRVIALPGDTIAVAGGVPVLNGKPLQRELIGDFIIAVSPNTKCAWAAVQERDADGENVCRYKQYRETLPSGESYNVLDFGILPQDSFAPIIVPQNSMFVMGDNRDNSQDSRFPARPQGGVGIVQQDLLVGRASVLMFSTDGGAEWVKPWTWFSAARWDRIGDGL